MIARDWGWAPEYVDAMWRMMQLDAPRDVLIATGQTHPLDDFIQEAFAEVGLDGQEHVESNPALIRPTELAVSRADPSLASTLLGWQATTRMQDVARKMVRAELELLRQPGQLPRSAPDIR
jgi:GDPmannose 4,6-dehydratase